ncbi:unnamed protein product [Chironomus riparius]|uniref:Secreted protein n=1 Tax=Chironomus riparius TaxID=315576 RepID=A0A9N9S1J7_9DIPT|nr:unnamed protein product [Chironomus riparius]
MKILITIFVVLLSYMLTSARVIKYEHNLEFVKYEVDQANSQEEDHLNVQIYTIGAMESKFNKLADELTKQQQHILNKSRIGSEKLLEKLNEDTQKINENFIEIIILVKENLNDFKNAKNETESKKLNITKDFMMEILTYENDLNLKTILCKNSTDLLNNEKKFLTKLLDGCSQCKVDRIENIKNELQAANKNLKMENDYCEESAQFLRDKISKLRSDMTDKLIKLLQMENQEFKIIIDKFYVVSKLENFLDDFTRSRTKYLSEKEQLESNLQSKLSNLNKMLIFDSIKQKSGEVIYNTNKNELDGEDFLQDFLTEVNGNESNQQSHVIESLQVEEPEYIKWEKIHEKTRYIPENSVIAGYDVDGATLYVVRACNDNECTYGKYARLDWRMNAYIPYNNVEKGEQDVEILTTLNYKWCSHDKNRSYDNLPVCRVEYKNSKIPGTLQKDGKCRIGYAWKIVLLENNIEVLGVNGC